MKTYKCHKVVQAAKVVAFQTVDDGRMFCRLDDGKSFAIPDSMRARYEPAVGDYLVEYRDGYRSFSPAKEFEEGYTLVDE